MARRLPLVLTLTLALGAGIAFGACGVLTGVPIFPDGGSNGGDAGAPGPDGGGVTDGGTTDAGGGTPWCGQVAPPDAPGLCCASCSAGQSGCQPNGCYGGWWCNTQTCSCVSPTAACGGGSDGGTDGGTPPTVTPLSCTTSATYDTAESTGSCGSWRWSIKTGGDAAASGVDLSNVQLTTVAHLASLTPPSQIAAGNGMYLPRQAPTETQVFELKDVHLSFDKLEDDSDYHLVVSDGSGSMIVEVPYPGCVTTSSPFYCTITHARHDVEQYLHPTTSAGYPSYTVSVVGVAFFDEIHGQTGVAPNGIELHPVLRICFGKGCDPLQAP